MSDLKNPQLELPNLLNPNPPVEKTEENPWQGDCAGREKFANKLTMMIENIGEKSSAVILLNGKWGTGKTFFLESLQLKLKSEKYRAIYFDAFAEDFSSDPLLAICGQLQMELGAGKEVEKVLKDVLAIGGIGTEILLQFCGISIDITGAIKKINNVRKTNQGLHQYVESRKNLKRLQSDLSSIVKKGDKPLVFIIDELDRCRPTFSLELLERVKHLFQVPGIIFVLGANKESLMKSVRSQYGDQDAEYLQKFFDWEWILPDARPSHLIRRYVDNLKYEVLSEDGKYKTLTDMGITNNVYYPLMDVMGVSFRQAEMSVKMFLHCFLISNKKDRELSHKIAAIACLTLLKVNRPDLYADIAYKGGTCKKVINEMSPLFDEATHLDEAEVKICRDFFNKLMCLLAEKEEKERIGEILPNSHAGKLQWVRERFLDRSKVITMLENLDC